MPSCAYIISKGKESERRCDRKAAGSLIFCTQHAKTKGSRKALSEMTSDRKCQWLIVVGPEVRSYQKEPRACTRCAIQDTRYCVVHLFLEQAWDDTVKCIPPRCSHIARTPSCNKVCQNEIRPGYKKCKQHSRGRGRPRKSSGLRTNQSSDEVLRGSDSDRSSEDSP